MPLFEKTQRRLCRALFVAGCVLPTIAVAATVAGRAAGVTQQAMLAAVSDALGVRVECESLRTPRPGVYELAAVRLLADDGLTIATCDRVQADRSDGGWRLRTRSVVLHVGDDLGELASQLLARDLWGALACESIELRDASGDSASIGAARWSLGPSDEDDARRLVVEETEGVGRIALATSPGGEVLRIATGSHAAPLPWLPCELLAGCDANGWRFTGEWAVTLGAERRGSAVGRLETTDLETPRAVAASGTVRVDRLAWTINRLTEFEGRVALRDGLLSRKLVEGLVESLGVRPFAAMSTWLADPADYGSFPFTLAACELRIGADGIDILAGCEELDGQLRGGAVAHSIATFQGEPLLREPSERSLPPVRLVRALWHGRPAEVPAAPAAIALAGRLPTAESPQR